MLTKFASAQVIAARVAQPGDALVKDAHRHSFAYDPRPGFLYVRSRAISSRTNDNFDHFPAEEIKKAYRTFVGKPVFVNHHNENHRRARGVIVDAALHEDVNPDGSPDTWVEVLMEVDAIRFPKLAEAVVKGEIDRTSMGTDVAFSVCSYCNNKATSPVEYCAHIPRMKGKKVHRRTASGEAEQVLIYEKCYGLGFFENSLLVEQPADPTAYTLGGVEGTPETLAMFAQKTAGVINPEVPVPDYLLESYYAEHPHERPAPKVVQPEGPDLLNPDLDRPEIIRWEPDLLKRNDPGWAPRDLLATSKTASKTASVSVSEMDAAPDGAVVTIHIPESAFPSGGIPLSYRIFTKRSDGRWHQGTADVNGATAQQVLDAVAKAPEGTTIQMGDKTPGPFDGGRTLSSRKVAEDTPADRQPYVCPDCGKWRNAENCPHCDAEETIRLLDEKRRGPSIIDWIAHGLLPSGAASLTRDALNETLAPAKVDTLRDEACPVCGEADSYDGDKCRVCNFIRPPAEFMDPDLEKARQVDLRQDKADAAEQAAGAAPQDLAADPNAPQGHPLEDGAAQPDYMKKQIPKDQGAPGDPAAGGTPLWQQKTRPKDPAAAGGAAPAEGQMWKQRTRPKTAGLDTQKEQSMRPALAALAAQQKEIDGIKAAVASIADLAGLSEHPAVVAALAPRTAEDENPAQPKGWANPGGGGTESPAVSTDEAAKPTQGTDNVESQGTAPGTDVKPDATTSLDSNEVVLDATLDLNEQDPTKPVAGTEDLGEGAAGQAGTNRTETEVRAGTPSDTGAAFSETGWTASAQVPEARYVASLRLARLRMQAGIERASDDLTLGTTIASSQMGDVAIQQEIETLTRVLAARPQQATATVDRRLVPQRAVTASAGGQGGPGVARTMPSMAGGGGVGGDGTTTNLGPKVASVPDEAEFLLE